MRITLLAVIIFHLLLATNAYATTLNQLDQKIEKLVQENKELRTRIENFEDLNLPKSRNKIQKDILLLKKRSKKNFKYVKNKILDFDESVDIKKTVQAYGKYSYVMLDPTTRINRKQSLLLKLRKYDKLTSNNIYLSAATTAIVNYQESNTDSKFGYLMRHPTANNQRTKESSEAVIHSVQLGLTGTLGDSVTSYIEILYDPEQSFGQGTNTSLARNQLQVRKAYVLFGNLKETPFYAALGKMSTPFGLTDTVSPFTASTVWHAFGGLAYGLSMGYFNSGFTFRTMAIQGGAQFRATQTTVDNSNVPSKLNNFAIDASYLINNNNSKSWSLLVGASYLKGSNYCAEFPISHFATCSENNPAFDIYSKLKLGKLTLQAELAKTLKVWPGTFNPTIPQFPAHKVTSFHLGGKYSLKFLQRLTDLSFEFSRFISGPHGSPWQKQDQIVFGLGHYLSPSVKLFSEYIRTSGYAPLNNISGDGITAGETHSVSGATSNILMLGVTAAF